MVYIVLFLISFLSATLLPLSSEALLLYNVSQGFWLPLLWIVATLGNTFGSMLNYWLGLKGENYVENKGYLSSKKIDKARVLFSKYGGIILLLSWVPIIGDPLTFLAGILRYNFKLFTLIVLLSKGLRYLIIILFSHYIVS